MARKLEEAGRPVKSWCMFNHLWGEGRKEGRMGSKRAVEWCAVPRKFQQSHWGQFLRLNKLSEESHVLQEYPWLSISSVLCQQLGVSVVTDSEPSSWGSWSAILKLEKNTFPGLPSPSSCAHSGPTSQNRGIFLKGRTHKDRENRKGNSNKVVEAGCVFLICHNFTQKSFKVIYSHSLFSHRCSQDYTCSPEYCLGCFLPIVSK